MNSLLTSAAPISGERALLSPFFPTHKPSSFPPLPKSLHLPLIPLSSKCRALRAPALKAAVSSSASSDRPNTVSKTLRAVSSSALLLAALLSGCSLRPLPALADSAPPATEELIETETSTDESNIEEEAKPDHSPLSQFLDSNSDAVAVLRTLLYAKLEEGDDSEALAVLRRLMAAQPAENEWKFLAARLLNEMGEAAESRRLFEEILAADPLSFEALFENAVLMDRCGEGDAVIERLEGALELARAERQEKAARDVRLIMAQMQFLQKRVEEALSSYEELAREDPKDYRPYFCQGVIYSLMDRNKEAREKFSKYHELSPRKFEVDAYLQTPLSRVKICGSGDSQT